jgi:hypothetical protein
MKNLTVLGLFLLASFSTNAQFDLEALLEKGTNLYNSGLEIARENNIKVTELEQRYLEVQEQLLAVETNQDKLQEIISTCKTEIKKIIDEDLAYYKRYYSTGLSKNSEKRFKSLKENIAAYQWESKCPNCGDNSQRLKSLKKAIDENVSDMSGARLLELAVDKHFERTMQKLYCDFESLFQRSVSEDFIDATQAHPNIDTARVSVLDIINRTYANTLEYIASISPVAIKGSAFISGSPSAEWDGRVVKIVITYDVMPIFGKYNARYPELWNPVKLIHSEINSSRESNSSSEIGNPLQERDQNK